MLKPGNSNRSSPSPPTPPFLSSGGSDRAGNEISQKLTQACQLFLQVRLSIAQPKLCWRPSKPPHARRWKRDTSSLIGLTVDKLSDNNAWGPVPKRPQDLCLEMEKGKRNELENTTNVYSDKMGVFVVKDRQTEISW
jgi:hypothetical protein